MKIKRLKLKTVKGDGKRISIVKRPHIGISGLAFSMDPLGDSPNKMQFAVDESKQILIAPVMIPNLVMVKSINGAPTEVVFTEEEVREFMFDFEKAYLKSDGKVFNLEHGDKIIPVTRLETWFVLGDGDKARTVYNFDVPDGTPMISLFIEDKAFFNDYVKAGVGFSIEGLFEEELVEEEFVFSEEEVMSIVDKLGLNLDSTILNKFFKQ